MYSIHFFRLNSRKINKNLLIFLILINNLNFSKLVSYSGATVMHQLIHITWSVIFVMLKQGDVMLNGRCLSGRSKSFYNPRIFFHLPLFYFKWFGSNIWSDVELCWHQIIWNTSPSMFNIWTWPTEISYETDDH